eukprot:s658_g15.t3
MKAAFNYFDRDRDGHISLSELSSGHLLGALSLEELHEIMTWCDENGNGQIEFKEFETMMSETGPEHLGPERTVSAVLHWYHAR